MEGKKEWMPVTAPKFRSFYPLEFSRLIHINGYGASYPKGPKGPKRAIWTIQQAVHFWKLSINEERKNRKPMKSREKAIFSYTQKHTQLLQYYNHLHYHQLHLIFYYLNFLFIQAPATEQWHAP